ncbi:uncharacterized protein DUF3971 [Humitalea rosea]|uniref:Uncharacterized protein DUF3971 n=1 Tax=Humitalea rosea TaxID=990373 RepID=A0A2W7IEN8_9PROT|nr:AsmA-like C-terminal region-containing protein [Humitalea rosea]PZW44929.1 uncharacterized protein DUF3971 [Humitalea rosea]
MLRLLMAVALLTGLGIAALAWRLGKEPIDLPWRAAALQQLLDEQAGTTRIRIGGMSIAWAGWREGHLSPLALRITEVEITDAAQHPLAAVPVVEVGVSLTALLRGDILPSSIDLDAPSVTLLRGADGVVALDMGGLLDGGAAPADASAPIHAKDALEDLLHPPPGTLLAELRRVRVRGGRVLVHDAVLGADWMVDRVMVTISRAATGTLGMEGAATLTLGKALLPLRLSGEHRPAMAGEAARGSLRLDLANIRPATLAANLPNRDTTLAQALHTALGTVDAPVSLGVTLRTEASQAPRFEARVELGAGTLGAATGPRASIAGAEAVLSGTAERIELSRATLRLAAVVREAGAATAPAPVLALSGSGWRDGEGLRAAVDLRLDRVEVGDLAGYWPPGLGRGARDWVLENVSAGTATDGRWRIEASASPSLSGLEVTSVSGTLSLSDTTVHWLRPMPPVGRAHGTITFGKDEVLVQAEGMQGGIEVRDVSARFFALTQPQELAEIQVRSAGAIPDLLALIRHPRLKLFDRRPLELSQPGGRAEAAVTITFPLISNLPVERVDVHATARLTQVRLADVLLGRGIERGTFDLTVNTETLRATGTATIAGIVARTIVEMDFRNGPGSQVIERERIEARGEARLLAGLGLDVSAVADGPVRVEAVREQRRDGQGRVTLNADLAETRLFAEPLAWDKPSGAAASLEAVLRLAGKDLTAIESFRLTAPALSARGRVGFGNGGRLDRIEVTEAALHGGRFAADLRPPAGAGQPWRVRLSGASFDMGPMLLQPESATRTTAATDPPLQLELRLARLLLGPERWVADVSGEVRLDAEGAVQQAHVTGAVPARTAVLGGPQGSGAGTFEATVTPDREGRALRLIATNAGGLLRALDVLESLEGGRLSVTGRWQWGGLLSGDATMEDFAMHGVPGFGKVLQALTLYGLVDALQSSGLHFDRLVAPFTFRAGQLTVREARAYSSSLGITARGWVDRRRQRLDLQGTIVPAYIINSLLGNLPLIGRLFSLESGGGLFAATFGMTGSLADPQVSVNPLAALTPGFLRGIFGTAPQPAPANP